MTVGLERFDLRSLMAASMDQSFCGRRQQKEINEPLNGSSGSSIGGLKKYLLSDIFDNIHAMKNVNVPNYCT